MDSREMKRKVCTCRVVSQLAGIVLVVLGAVLAIFWPRIFEHLLAKELVLSPKAKSYEQWKKPSVPLYMDVYFFNWTNSEDFLNVTTKPIMKELGPYRFREIRDKKKIVFNDRNSTVSYRTFSTFFFDEDGSNGTLDDVITQLNIVVVGASGKAITLNDELKSVISKSVDGHTIAVSKRARELLFEGYEDDILNLSRMFPNKEFNVPENPYDRVGWFYLRNATDELSGNYNVHTGKSDISKLGTIQNFNHLNQSNLNQTLHYSGECSRLHGSSGEFFPPKQLRDSISLFTPEICRSIPFDYEKDFEVHGITGYRFAAGERAVDNGTKFAENLCYNEPRSEPFLSGVMNISVCRYESPVFMSFPHYFAGDPFYVNEVKGLEPNKEKHESYFTLEPMTGAPLEVTIRLQANFLVRPIDNATFFQDVPRIFMPAMWFEQKFAMDSIMAQQIKFAVLIPWIGRCSGFAIIAVGLVLILMSSFISFMESKKQSHKMEVNLRDGRIDGRRKKEVSPLIDQIRRSHVSKSKNIAF